MKVTPRSEQEIQDRRFLQKGIYNFVVFDAIEGISQTGKERIQLILKVINNSGHEVMIYDYISDSMDWKLRHFAESVGLMDKYEKGEILSHDCVDKRGMVEIIIQEEKIDSNGKTYPRKNAVKDYMPATSIKPSSLNPIKKENEFIDDDVPF